MVTQTVLFLFLLTWYTLFRLDISYFYIVHETGKGLMSYAHGRPTKDQNSNPLSNGFECTSEMRDKMLELRNDFNMHNKTKMLLFISIATNNMVTYVSMYPEVWFLDCTYSEIIIPDCAPFVCYWIRLTFHSNRYHPTGKGTICYGSQVC